jgi:hypothetical protein
MKGRLNDKYEGLVVRVRLVFCYKLRAWLSGYDFRGLIRLVK